MRTDATLGSRMDVGVTVGPGVAVEGVTGGRSVGDGIGVMVGKKGAGVTLGVAVVSASATSSDVLGPQLASTRDKPAMRSSTEALKRPRLPYERFMAVLYRFQQRIVNAV
jgi:hypothetical protein